MLQAPSIGPIVTNSVSSMLSFPRSKNLTGQRFGRLVAIEPVGKRDREVVWRCHCDCGGTVDTRGSSLRRGHTQSCGCLAREARQTEGSVVMKDRRGLRYGKLVVLDLESKRNKR